MLLLANLRIAVCALVTHGMRSALSMLAVIIGVAALVLMMALGAAASERLESQIRSLGSNLIMLTPGTATVGGVRLGTGSSVRLSEDDATAIAAEVPGVAVAAPVNYVRVQLAFRAENWASQARGVTLDYFEAREWALSDGRFFDQDEADRGAKVVLIGQRVREILFGGSDPLGETIRLGRVPFTVIGVLAAKGQGLQGEDQDDVVIAPIASVRRQLIGVNPVSPRMAWYILVKQTGEVDRDDVMRQIRRLLGERHRLQPGQEEGFNLMDLSEIAATEAALTRTMSLLLAAIASIALLVGGIGIMNIMSVSVIARTREIGLRMAVGARRRDILFQFLTEAATLTAIGGVVGVIVALACASTAAHILGWEIHLQSWVVFIALVVSGLLGVFFGLYPARQAARLDPIEALRYE